MPGQDFHSTRRASRPSGDMSGPPTNSHSEPMTFGQRSDNAGAGIEPSAADDQCDNRGQGRAVSNLGADPGYDGGKETAPRNETPMIAEDAFAMFLPIRRLDQEKRGGAWGDR